MDTLADTGSKPTALPVVGTRDTRDTRDTRGSRDSRESESGLDEVVVRVYRCATVVKGGRRFSFGALVVVGDRRGRVGIGYGKSIEVASAVEKGKRIAAQNMLEVKLVGGTIPHRVTGQFGASQVIMVPAGAGTGVIAGASTRAVLELAGVRDVLTKSFGSTSPKNLVRAAYDGLTKLLNRSDVERLRGVKLALEAEGQN